MYYNVTNMTISDVKRQFTTTTTTTTTSLLLLLQRHAVSEKPDTIIEWYFYIGLGHYIFFSVLDERAL